jgi:hypothetical protein
LVQMVADDDPGPSPPTPDTQGNLHDRALGKAADEFGKEIAPLGREIADVTARTVRLALRGLSDVITGAERIYDWMEAALIKRLKDVPENELAPPSARIALPALQGAVFASEEPEAPIREMFANLIAKDMTKQGKRDVHPSFVEIVKQLSTDDAKVLQYFHQHGSQLIGEINLTIPNQPGFRTIGQYVTVSGGFGHERSMRSVYSLARLGLIEINFSKFPLSSEFDELEKAALQESSVQLLVEHTKGKTSVRKGGLYLTPIGHAFVRVCLN